MVRGGAAARAALSAEVQAAMFMCARSSWCASLPLAAGAIAWVNRQNSVSLPESPGVSQIPGYTRPLTPDQEEGRTVTPADRVKEPTSTSTPGDGLTGPTDTGGKQIAQPKPGDGVTISPIPEPLGPDMMTNAPGHQARMDEIATNIHPGQQGKHIPGDNNFIPGRSPLNADTDPQKLLDGARAGLYPVVGTGSRGQLIVDFGHAIGVDAATGLSTRYGTIHSGKNGAHIVPTNPNIVEVKE